VLKRTAVYLVIVLLLHSCASQVAPTGGPEDETPPEVVRATPSNLTTHFDASKIILTFNEFIQPGDFASQVFFLSRP
jgi:hypothetical protein